ncbi:CLC_0170 family protein [Paenibacillus sp. GYB003]|uniref:CLC_0170 family protein n=1 Tax=Paenibacillus sp. GYB003 TaxID=2994392 RepID=UPI002F9614D5
MESVGYVGFLSYAVYLWLISGVIMLWVDAKTYELAGMIKERNVCRWIGWLNVSLGLLAIAGSFALRKWFW